MITIKKTAIVYCENQFGLVDGKTATGLVRHSDLYTIVGIIDSSLAGKDAGEELGEERNGIPIFFNLKEALANLSNVPDCYIYGKAPLEACISNVERSLILEAMEKGMDIINGLHEFFTDDIEFVNMALRSKIAIRDIRKPPLIKNLHVFTGKISRVNIPVIAVLGTDCACGKRTTAIELNKALNDSGIQSVLIATGQSAIMQGAKYGISLDALISQFAVGEVENSVVEAFDKERPDIILVEGQSAVGHPAFLSSISILKGCMPDGIILQHPPGRKKRCDFPDLAMPGLKSEIELIESISQTKVQAITLSHENLTENEVIDYINKYEKQYALPTTDILSYGCEKLIQVLKDCYPGLNKKIAV